MNPFAEKIAINLVTGVMGSLIPKLAELLKEEYKLKKSVKDGIRSLEMEMKTMHAALCKVAEVPRDQLDEQVKLWAGEVRELSFDMEDIVDKFLVRVDDGSELATNSNKLKQLTEKMAGLFTKGKARHQIAEAIKDITKHVQEVANRRGRYTVDNIVVGPTPVATIDPRLGAMYREVSELVGIAGKRQQELMDLLSLGYNESRKKLKIISVVGFGGLGKTTLVRTVYDEIKGDFDCRAFVPIGRNADAKKVFLDILIDLRMYKSEFTMFNERQLIDILREVLENKRYLIVIDDIWDEKLWMVINLAFSRSNNAGSRLITTTRIDSVSKVCCSYCNDSIYRMMPLNDDDSKRLLYTRIFFHESGCPPEFEEVSVDILRKCGGVPLAIITIASLLAGDRQVKHVDEWHALLNSIGRGLTEDSSVEEMLRILSFSYYDLPSHLKTCLLYLSMFPEEYEIQIDKLIWMWIAEGFVQCKNAGTSLFDIGETYFNELVNRNMIQLVNPYDAFMEVEACRVHDMVLDLICKLSREDNFVTIYSPIGTDGGMCSQSSFRRLSIQSSIQQQPEVKPLKPAGMSQVRSVVTFGAAIGLLPSFASFVVLRVLDLSDFHSGYRSHHDLRNLGSLLHLRYLGLARTEISKVPEEVGKLQFLQVLDVNGNKNVELPSTVTKLRRLMCLDIGLSCKWLPVGLANMTSLEELSHIRVGSLSMMNEMCSLLRLRKLGICFGNFTLEMEEAFVVSLDKMFNIQSLQIFADGIFLMDLLGERWVPPRNLREFMTQGTLQFTTLPAWIRRNPSHLSQLSFLRIHYKEVRQEDLGFLGRLPALRNLELCSELLQSGGLLVGNDGFGCLTSFKLSSGSSGSSDQIMFQLGAMPKAERVSLIIGVRVAKEEAAGIGDDCSYMGMENLLSLRIANVTFWSTGVSVREARQAKTALENALRIHPNHPTFRINIWPQIPEGAPDDHIIQ